jgi:hypothetical protein
MAVLGSQESFYRTARSVPGRGKNQNGNPGALGYRSGSNNRLVSGRSPAVARGVST